ncbi:myosin light chain kinase, smooth muscle-like [Dreissena polymorpha]|uniref:myosin light chain kinase, smooth muscle-like n=1 Tax=Dreissena polymorpha TaxID=45954 RepID=UPI0022650A10|nr:myosin light chain kinase, smooth muscle-like [Dreissena polymorpha]
MLVSYTEATMDTTYLYTLSADHVTANDNGDWRCEIENAFGKSSATCKVKVIDPKCDVVPSGEAPPRFLIALSNAMGPEDGTTELVCQTEGTEELKVKWFRNDNPIDDFSPDIERFVMTSEQGTHVLTIRRVKPRDAGVYKCKVSNDLGWTSCDAKFTVIKHAPVIPYSATDFPVAMELMERRREEAVMTTFEKDVDFLSHDMFDSVAIQTFLLKWRVDKDVPLHFPIHLKSRCAVEGSMTVMGCLVAGKPPYKVRWFKGATEIYESSKYYIDQRGPLLSLTIPRSEEDDTGNYTCTVRNCGSKVSSTCYLQIEPVLEITTEVPTKPLFVTKLRRQTVDEGQCITFQVQVTGNPRPGFKWSKDGLELHDSERVQTEVTRKGHAHLLIQNATFLDNGLYSCEAHNFAGRAQTMASVRVRDHFEQQLLHERQMTYSDENASLTDGVQNGNSSLTNGVSSPGYSLKQESQMFEHLPRFRIQLPREITVRGRERFLLEICAGGNPRPIVQWFKDGYQIYEGINYNFLSVGEWAGLEVINPLPRDAGRYMVKIVNDLGSVTSVCDVTMDLPLVEGKAIERQDLETTEELICQPGACVVLLQGEVDSSLSLAQIVPSSHL